jgi:hypothetical protein
MCTVSWFHEDGGFQLFFNRDERRRRRSALPPSVHRKGSTRFVAPVDGDFGGSWIGANEHGLALGLLNGYADDDGASPPDGWTSRGLLLTALIDSRSAAMAERRLAALPLERFRSFVLLMLAPGVDERITRWSGRTLRRERRAAPSGVLSSSSFRTEDVLRSRFELLEHMRASQDADPVGLHLEYHASHWPERGPYSVCMHRDDARTVSLTHVRVDAGEVALAYAADSPCRAAPGEPVKIERSPAAQDGG